jgi:hypothetical protein
MSTPTRLLGKAVAEGWCEPGGGVVRVGGALVADGDTLPDVTGGDPFAEVSEGAADDGLAMDELAGDLGTTELWEGAPDFEGLPQPAARTSRTPAAKMRRSLIDMPPANVHLWC